MTCVNLVSRDRYFHHFLLFLLSLFFFPFGRHFAQWEVDEDKVVDSWISHMDTDRDVRELGAVKK